MQYPERHMQRWDAREDTALARQLYSLHMSVEEIAAAHQRTCVAITMRMEQLNIKEPLPMPQLETPDGKFWMLQNGEMRPVSNTDTHGNRILDYPGRSVFTDKPTAAAAAKEMAKRHPDKKFYLMEAVEVFETKRPPITRTKL